MFRAHRTGMCEPSSIARDKKHLCSQLDYSIKTQVFIRSPKVGVIPILKSIICSKARIPLLQLQNHYNLGWEII